jgi:hypothetical protein
MMELVTIRRFGDMSEALLAKGCLDSAGIECFLADPILQGSNGLSLGE